MSNYMGVYQIHCTIINHIQFIHSWIGIGEHRGRRGLLSTSQGYVRKKLKHGLLAHQPHPMSRPGIFPASRPHLIWSLWNAPEMQDIMKLESLHAPHCCLKTPESTLLYTHTANFEKSPWYRFGNSTRYDKRQAHQARVLILDMLAHSLPKSHIHKTKTTTSTPHPTCHLSALFKRSLLCKCLKRSAASFSCAAVG